MDDQARFWIAQEVADTKYSADIRQLFKQAKTIADKDPRTLITDGAPNFHEAFNDEVYTSKLTTRPEHIRDIRFDGTAHNNKMEGMNGEIRDRERVMRTLEKADRPHTSRLSTIPQLHTPTHGTKAKHDQKRLALP